MNQPSVSSREKASLPPASGVCLVCGAPGAQVFFELPDMPVLCNAPSDTQAAARAVAIGQIQLAFCSHCGLVFNPAFSEDLIAYDQGYENSLHYSRQFDQYVRGLANDLVVRLDLHSKDIIEIGCGKGDFLAMLSELGGNRCVGFDRSFEPDRLDGAAEHKLEIIRDFYQGSYSHLPCDLLCCRQVLEHIPAPIPFLKELRRTLGSRPQTITFFEVPNALYTLRHRGIWDIIYEHVSYFWSLPLSHLFASCGFSVQNVRETYGGQFLCLEAVPDEQDVTPLPQDPRALAQVAEEVREFLQVFEDSMGAASRVMDGLSDSKGSAVIWGSGSKGVTFLNLFKDREALTHAVDINPHKQGKFVPGTGHPIVSPDVLSQVRPDVIFVMNPLYRNEIAQQLAALGLHPELVNV